MNSRILLLLSAFLTSVSANNDWSKPCLSGVCEYDIPTSAGSASGTLKIWGAKNAIGDITPAAGWEIIDCSPDDLEQDIRLVCRESSSDNCARLYTKGAEGKVVRLPESCGRSAFAVVTDSWVPDDQSIPSSMAASLTRRDGSAPQVKALRLTNKFDSVDTSKRTTGAVNFAIQAANFPGAAGEVQVDTTKRWHKSSRIAQRGLGDFVGKTIGAITSLNNFNVDKSTGLEPITVNKTFNLIDQKISCPPVDASLKIDVTSNAQATVTIGVAASGTFLPPNIEEFGIVTGLSAQLEGTVDVAAGITGTLDSGKINLLTVPIGGIEFPGILTLGPTFQVDAQAIAKLDVDLGMTVGVNYKVDNAQLVFPPNSNKPSGGNFNVQDTPLKLSASPNAKATGTLEAHLIPSLNLGLSVLNNFTSANVFLELDGSAALTLGLEAAIKDIVITPRALAAGAKAKRAPQGMQIRGATTPGYYFWRPPTPIWDEKPTVGDDKPIIWDENVTSRWEHSATTTSGYYEPTAAHTSSAASYSSSPSPSAVYSSEGGHAITTITLTAAGHSSTSSVYQKNTPKMMKASSITGSESISTHTWSAPTSTATGTNGGTEGSSGSFSGCVEIGAGFDVNAGADASFFGLFNAGTKVPLFSKKFELFKKCFGTGSASPPSIAPRAQGSSAHVPRWEKHSLVNRDIVSNLLCPATDITAAQAVVDQIIAAVDIKSL